jgi:glutamate-1-semialdehyde 2,1-aminomutase
MGCVPGTSDFLNAARRLTQQHGALLIFDEVMTGFRLAWGGVQVRDGIEPDLTCLAKIVGGGLPLAAVGGRRAVMEQLAPLGPVYQAGTLSGNPLAVAAGLATLDALDTGATYTRLEGLGARLEAGLLQALTESGLPGCINRVGSMWTLFFGPTEVTTPADARGADCERYGRWFHAMRDRRVALPPSQFESAFISLAHDEALIDETIAAAREALTTLL